MPEIEVYEIEPERKLLELLREAPSVTEAPAWDAVYPYHRHEEGLFREVVRAVREVLYETEAARVCVGLEGMDSTLCAAAAARACEEYGVELVCYTVGFYPGMPRELVHARAYLVASELDSRYETPVYLYHLDVPPPVESKRELCRLCGRLRFEVAAQAFPGSVILGGANFGEAPHRARLDAITHHGQAIEYRPLLELGFDKGHVVAALREVNFHFPRLEWWKNESGCGVRDYLRDPDPEGVLEAAEANDTFHRILLEEGAWCGHHYDTAVVLYDGERVYPVLIPLPWGWGRDAQRAAEAAFDELADRWEVGNPEEVQEVDDPPLESILKRARQLGTVQPSTSPR
ncbi:hypothetical protein [Methanopyrus kandleri]|uniref:Uncharacterized protein n=1 Tax=Methanopyrus kandleri (strain AV19 / DSM 6324 / JCM 9639 / NBRC 100938) TaxID=190192 RepID=Q8TW04_METKA|nr:hypothetical protein [Methanopyrus kandleri]AAM02447.1 Uncharacterized protein MK1234 [Methanopyrus kandleri AV19]